MTLEHERGTHSSIQLFHIYIDSLLKGTILRTGITNMEQTSCSLPLHLLVLWKNHFSFLSSPLYSHSLLAEEFLNGKLKRYISIHSKCSLERWMCVQITNFFMISLLVPTNCHLNQMFPTAIPHKHSFQCAYRI